MDQESDEDKIKAAQRHLSRLLWDDYTNRLFNMTAFSANNRTKFLDDTEVRYIVDGLDYKGRFRKDWEGREEFMWRFLDTMINRGYAKLLLSAAAESSKKGVDWNAKPSMAAEITLNEWIDKENERFNSEM